MSFNHKNDSSSNTSIILETDNVSETDIINEYKKLNKRCELIINKIKNRKMKTLRNNE